MCAHLTRTGGLQPAATIKAHDYAINSVTLHPSKEVVVTASDDHTWKMWAYPRYGKYISLPLKSAFIEIIQLYNVKTK